MDLPLLVDALGILLTPAIPHLAKAGGEAAKEAAKEAGKKLGTDGWAKIQEIWTKIRPRVEAKEAAREAVEDLAAAPEDSTRIDVFKWQLEKILARDATLVRELVPLVEAAQKQVVQRATARDGVVIQTEGGVEGGIHVTIEREPSEVSGVRTAAESGADSRRAAGPLREAYLHDVVLQCRRLALFGVDPTMASRGEEATLELDAVYTALLTLGQAEDEEWTGAALMDSREQSVTGAVGSTLVSGGVRRRSALEELNREQRLVLLGDPGSGKSTFVNFVALCMAGEILGRKDFHLELLRAPLPGEKKEHRLAAKEDAEPQPWDQGVLLPVRVVLRDFAARGLPEVGEEATAAHLWDFIAVELGRGTLGKYEPELERELREEGGLVLLDGLDEVPEAERRRMQIRQAVEGFTAEFPRCRFLVTSRTYAYRSQKWRLREFSEAVLAPFSGSQVRLFVDRWYAHVARRRGQDESDAQGRAEKLKRAIFAGDRLRPLAERPLLLTLMASLHAWRGGSLPDERVVLYADAVELLLDSWERQRVVTDRAGQPLLIQPSLTEWLKVERSGRILGLLNETAYRAHAGQPELAGTADIVEGLLALSPDPDLKPARLIEYLRDRAGLLVPRGVGIYALPHRTFQEYLAACHLTDHDYPDEVARLVRQDPARWREVTLLAGAKAGRGTSSAAWDLVDALCPEREEGPGGGGAEAWGAQVAGQVLVESLGAGETASRRQRPRLERVRGRLREVVEGDRLPAVERVLAGANLARLGDPREEVQTVDAMDFCLVPAGRFRMGSEEGEASSYEEERPAHDLELEYPFRIGRYAVTQAQYGEFVEAGGYEDTGLWEEAALNGFWSEWGCGGLGDSERRQGPTTFGDSYELANHPVVGVSWYEALAFTRWVTARWRASGRLPEGWAVKLPSEAEWEKAARGGERVCAFPVIGRVGVETEAPEMVENPAPTRLFPWAGAFDPENANVHESGLGKTGAVGCFSSGACPYGCEGMSGNVWEWTRSVWGRDFREAGFAYPYEAGDGRETLYASEDQRRVLRGGAFGERSKHTRCAARGRSHPYDRFVSVGFRVVMSPVSPGH